MAMLNNQRVIIVLPMLPMLPIKMAGLAGYPTADIEPVG